MVFQNNVLSGAAGSGTTVYAIDQSIRFNPADSAYMEKTFSSAGNKKTFTISLWLKRSLLGSRQDIWSFNQDVPLTFMADDTLRPYIFGNVTLQTNRKFRDPSAWYHIVFTIDSTNQISSDRIRMYVNGQRETSFSTEVYPSLNADADIWTSGTDLRLFRLVGGTNYHGGYAAEIHYLDGISYGPENFGEVNSSGIWIPKEYSGSYGTNGFKIDGRDSADLGDDESGNGNDFTTSGLAAHDQVSDSPTNNFATFNPIHLNTAASLARNATFKNGNIELFSSSGTADFCSTTIMPSAIFKGYAEFYVTHSGSDGFGSSGVNRIMVLDDNAITNATTWYSIYNSSGSITTSGESAISGTAWAKGDIIGVAVDMANNIKWYRNGSLLGTADVGASYQSLGYMYNIRIGQDTSKNPTIIANFGQEGTFAGNVTAGGNSDASGIGNFKYSVPSGFKALCTKNLGS